MGGNDGPEVGVEGCRCPAARLSGKRKGCAYGEDDPAGDDRAHYQACSHSVLLSGSVDAIFADRTDDGIPPTGDSLCRFPPRDSPA